MVSKKNLTKNYKDIYKNYIIIFILILLDLLMILLHFIFGLNYSLFNVDVESNIPTIYQGFKLLSFGYLFIFIVYLIQEKTKAKIIFWLSSAFMFIYLGLDEIGQIHENIPTYIAEISPKLDQRVMEFLKSINYNGSTWVFYYIPVIITIALPIFIFNTYYLFKNFRKALIPYVFGIIFLFYVPIIEINNSNGLLTLDLYNISIIYEEFLEMIGISFIVFSYLIALNGEKKLNSHNNIT